MEHRWRSTDPREFGDIRASIVILRPAPAGPHEQLAGTGYVDSDKRYSILTSFEDYRCIDADAKWNTDWWWIFAPTR
jgi:hypothetical protein